MDISSGTASHLLSLIPVLTEYETTIDILTKQVLFYTKEQEILRNDMVTLITENRTLAETVNDLLGWQTNHECKKSMGKLDNDEAIQNLKAQLNCAQKEKDTAVELWQTALKTIDNLESTLGLYEGRTHGYFSKTQVSTMKVSYENKINILNGQVQKLQNDLDECRKSLDTKNISLSKVNEHQLSTNSLVKHLEDDVRHLYEKLEAIVKMRNELKENLETKNQIIVELQTKDIESKRKVSEALQILEAACFEKDAALTRENEAKQEVLRMSKALSEIIDETTEDVKTDTEKMKQSYNNKLQRIQVDMLNLQKQLKEKDVQLTKSLQESALINQELDRIRKGNLHIEESQTSKLLILEKNLESTFQKLLLSEKKNLQLDAEKESVKSDLDQMASCYQNDIKMRETQQEVMKKQLKTLKVQLRASNTDVIQAVNKADEFKAQMKQLDAVIQEKLKLQQIMHEQSLSKSIEGIQSSNTKIQSELQRHVQAQRRLNKKIKKEMTQIIDQLETRMEELKIAKKSLEQDLKDVIKDNLYYKGNLKHFCSKVMKIAEINGDTFMNSTQEHDQPQKKSSTKLESQ